jgi:hypothetical protein
MQFSRKFLFMIKHIGLVLFLAAPWMSNAQTSDHDQVVAIIHKLFDGMYQADSSMARSVFRDDLTMATIYRDKDGVAVLKREQGADDFVKSVGVKRPEPLTEEIWNIQVQIDGDFAQAWCDYAFYVGHQFSHCGVDAFQLFKSKEGWKIFHITDTRKKTGCSIPKEIETKHKQG